MHAAVVRRYLDLRSSAEPIDPAGLRALMRVRPGRAAAAIAGEWLGIAAGIAVYEALGVGLLYPLLVVWIGSRMLGLWVLAHDGLHRLLLRPARANDAVTRLLLAWPLFLGFREFRRVHLAHHRHLKTPRDPEAGLASYPDFRFPLERGRLLRAFALDALGVNFARFFVVKRVEALRRAVRERRLPRPAAGRLAYYAAVLAAVAALGLGWELLLYWLVPYATWFTLVLRMRLMAEHLNLPEADHFQARSIVPTPLERWLFLPHHVGYHAEHHLYPGIPCYNLPEAHRRLRACAPWAERAPVRRGYLPVFAEFLRRA